MSDNIVCNKKKEKRKRSENFSKADLAYLCELVEANIDIIRSKQTNAITNAEKAKVWQMITNSVNSRAGGQKRSVEQIKEKWRKACSSAKMEAVMNKRSLSQTGGGPAVPAPGEVSQKIIDLHSDAPNFVGIEGGTDIGVVVSHLFPNITAKGLTCDENEDQQVYQIIIEEPQKSEKLNNLLEKAHGMRTKIKEFLQNYKVGIPLPRIGDCVSNKYIDTTKDITEEERDRLVQFLCTFKEINISVHDTISFILHYSPTKDADETVTINDKDEKLPVQAQKKDEDRIVENPVKVKATSQRSDRRTEQTSKRKMDLKDWQIECLKSECDKLRKEKELMEEQRLKVIMEKELLRLQIKKLRRSEENEH